MDLLCERRGNVLGLSAVGRVEVDNDDWVLLQSVLEILLAKANVSNWSVVSSKIAG
jgi:hypothetical protein